MQNKIRRILIPNRGEIASRIISTASKMEIETVVMLHKKEQNTTPALSATKVHWLVSDDLSQTYLNVDKIIEIAKNHMVDAIHPGYGFLSENYLLANACIKNNILFIGPRSEHLQLMGNKLTARNMAVKAGIPVIPSFVINSNDTKEAKNNITFPVLIKATMGGGGKGMLIVNSEKELDEKIKQASRESLNYFGDENVYIEQYFPSPRHIEIQILADSHGNIIHLYDRECSIQRRYQKVIEEAPSPNLPENIQKNIISDALHLAQSMYYLNAGTIEFILDENNKHYFLEMNTRIQVEHPVTEAITGIDIIEHQINIANGNCLTINQEDIKIKGHAIEARIYAESPHDDFLPSPGYIHNLQFSDNCRVDTHLGENSEIFSDYDPMIAKVISHQSNRSIAITMLKNELNNTGVIGIETNISFLQRILNHSLFNQANYHTSFIKDHYHELLEQTALPQVLILAYSAWKLSKIKKFGFFRHINEFSFNYQDQNFKITYFNFGKSHQLIINKEEFKIQDVEVDNFTIKYNYKNRSYSIPYKTYNHHITLSYGGNYSIHPTDWLPKIELSVKSDSDNHNVLIEAPMPGKIIDIPVIEGDNLKKGETVIILESMKMENHIKSHIDGIVDKIHIKKQAQVSKDQLLISLKN